ncbi:MAG: acyl-CoA thioester hydrolase/BAAT C-terminal domain-containing protein [Phycisphaerales bacterium]|nr:acyl-CoA thioester hydrolase/BAAT C-terminal domain-containing protein [Phycisphaerales bacterium]
MSPHQILCNLKKINYCVCFFLLFPFSLNAQFSKDDILKSYKFFSVNVFENTNFLTYRKNDLPKPTILFIGGSGFNPMFINGNFYGIPFDFFKYADSFNFIVLQKPNIPIFDDSTQNKFLNKSFPTGFYLDSTGNYPPEFVIKNDKNYYINAHMKVIQYLNKQSWVKKNSIVLIGHSQGALIATTLAVKSKAISKVVVMSPGSIFNRFHEFIRQVRLEEAFNWLSHDKAQQKIDSIYDSQRALLDSKNDAIKKYDPFSYKSYYSFNYPSFISSILSINQKTLLIYGTSSIQDLDCDYLKLYINEQNKNNIEIKAYAGYDHNYFENIFDAKGAFIEQKFHWDDVMKDVMEWIVQK